MAVLSLRQTDAGLGQTELEALTDQLRQQVIGSLPSNRYEVITKQNIEVLLQNQGKSLDDVATCDTECETEFGRLLGADYVISGTVTKVFGKLRVTLACHQTRLDAAKALAMARRDVHQSSQLIGGVDEAGMELLQVAFPQEVTASEQASGLASANTTPKPAERTHFEKRVYEKLGLDHLRTDSELKVRLEVGADEFLEGDSLTLSVLCSERCFIAVFNLYSDDSVGMLFPHEDGSRRALKAGQALVLPEAGTVWKMRLDRGDRKATEVLHVVAMRAPPRSPKGLKNLRAGIRSLKGGFSALAAWHRRLPDGRFAFATRPYSIVRR